MPDKPADYPHLALDAARADPRSTGPVHILGPAVEALTDIERRLLLQDRLQAKRFLCRHGLHFKADAVSDPNKEKS